MNPTLELPAITLTNPLLSMAIFGSSGVGKSYFVRQLVEQIQSVSPQAEFYAVGLLDSDLEAQGVDIAVPFDLQHGVKDLSPVLIQIDRVWTRFMACSESRSSCASTPVVLILEEWDNLLSMMSAEESAQALRQIQMLMQLGRAQNFIVLSVHQSSEALSAGSYTSECSGHLCWIAEKRDLGAIVNRLINVHPSNSQLSSIKKRVSQLDACANQRTLLVQTAASEFLLMPLS